MTSPTPTIIESPGEIDGLGQRILAGEVVVIRRGLQGAGILDAMLYATATGLRDTLGENVTRKIFDAGLEKIHEILKPDQIPTVTDAIYAEMSTRASGMLGSLMAFMFPTARGFYFEREPNVRFHIPFDLIQGHKKQFDEFAKKRGQGKIAPHGPHRDPWLDCPDNVINVWIAVGRVRRGNGLTIFTGNYRETLSFNLHGEINKGQKLSEPMTFDLEPGDIVLFHSDHVHGSEVNRTSETRYVVSYRVSFKKPKFPYGHYHRYLYSGLAQGALKSLSGIPSKAQWSYVRSIAARTVAKISGKGGGLMAPKKSPKTKPLGFPDSHIVASTIKPGDVIPYNDHIVVTRMEDDTLIALSRHCPHKGGDLADGFSVGQDIVCPWHNLPFNAATGHSDCKSLRPLIRYPVKVVDGYVNVNESKPLSKSA